MAREKVRPYVPVKTMENVKRSCELNGEIYDDLVALRDKVYELVHINENIMVEVETEQDYIKENLDVIVKTRKFQLENTEARAKGIVKRFGKLLDKLDNMVMKY